MTVTCRSPLWLSLSTALSWAGSKIELNKVYKEYEERNKEVIQREERPTFVQQCSLEDGCSIRFYGDETSHGNGRRFTKKTAEQTFYDGYGGDCSYKGQK